MPRKHRESFVRSDLHNYNRDHAQNDQDFGKQKEDDYTEPLLKSEDNTYH